MQKQFMKKQFMQKQFMQKQIRTAVNHADLNAKNVIYGVRICFRRFIKYSCCG